MKTILTAMMIMLLLAPSADAKPRAKSVSALPRVSISASGMSVNGEKFNPRGTNYLRMAGNDITTFEEGSYDPVRAEAMFQSQGDDRASYVRVFVPAGDWASTGVGGGTSQSAAPFNPAVISNIVDFVKRGARHGVYTSLVLQDFPRNCYFFKLVHDDGHCGTDYNISNVFGVNAMYMDPGYVKAKAKYMELFSAEMVTQLGADSTAVLTYATDNEATFDASQAPFTSWDASTVTLGGKTYRMNVAAERQEAADWSFVNYMLQAKAGLLRGDPNAKLTSGFYTNYAVNKVGFDGLKYCGTCAPTVNYKDTRYPARVSKVLSILDVVGMHFYPRPTTQAMVPGTGSYTVTKDLASVEMSGANLSARPLVIDEFGGFTSMYSTVTLAASRLKAARIETCKLGADGWAGWTFDTSEQLNSNGQQDLYTWVQNGETINQGQAPSLNPDPCK